MTHSRPIHRIGPGERLNRRLQPARRRRQGGVTLIDFIIGLVIGMLVVLAAIGTLIMMRGSARTMSDSASLEQQAALVMKQIGQQISQAGAINTCNGALCTTASGATAANAGILFDTGFQGQGAGGNLNGISGSTSTTKDVAGNYPSILNVSYAAPTDGSLQYNCIGNNPVTYTPSSTAEVVSKFSLNSQPSSSTSKNNNLVCGTGVAGSTSQPIASHVIDMQATYLVVTNSIQYLSAEKVADWSTVKGVQICLEMQGDPTQTPPLAAATLRDCLDNPIQPDPDGRLYRVVKQIFYLRNTN
jgi:type IV pilus assembly protein PilW